MKIDLGFDLHLVPARTIARWTMFLALATIASPAWGITNISGNLVLEARRLEGFANTTYGENSGNYVAPTSVEWSNFVAVADALWAGDIENVETLATNLSYEAVRFTDTNSGIILLGVRAQETNGSPVRGWGTYFVNTNFVTSALVEAPHPQNDIRTPMLAADVFLQARARGLLLAGAHRHANGDSTADPCDLTNTIFHAVHVAWSGTNSENTAWQLHGFSIGNHPVFPTNTMAVLSTGESGTNLMSTNLLILNQEFETRGIKAFAYNRNLASNDLLNVEVNEGVPGITFTNLGARQNVQGIFSRDAGGTFVHVETVTLIRTNDGWRATNALAIARAISPAQIPLAPFEIEITVPAVTNMVVAVPTAPATFYLLEQNVNLASTNWQPVATFTGDGQPRLLTNVNTGPARFFRARTRVP